MGARATLSALVVAFFIAFAEDASADFDYGVLVGEWASFQSNWFKGPSYVYFRLTPKFEGVYAQAFDGDSPLILTFSAADVHFDDGFVSISLRRGNSAPFRLVLSGYRSSEPKASLATGALYMFQLRNQQAVLTNTIFVRVVPIAASEELETKRELQTLRQLRVP